MPGNKIGGLKARETNIRLHGKDFYKRIGAIGGRNGHGPNYSGGFASTAIGADGMTGYERARKCGAIGGRKSRRCPVRDDIDKAEKILETESGRN